MSKEIIDKINSLKNKHNAVILAHNYQIEEVQDIADFVGDSLGLSIEASKTKADLIVFCGVHFMAETASILSPNKKVIVPEVNAGCPMADMITALQLIEFKKQHPGVPVVCYVNSSADVKAESDICCTSANARKVVESLKDAKEVIFVPDKYLGMYTQSLVKDKKFILWEGYCPTHVRILPKHIEEQKKAHPHAKVLVHPECRPEVTSIADKVLSTSGILKFAKESDAKEFIIGTEIGILHRLKKENPQKEFYPATEAAICPNMKLTSLEKLLWSLEDLKTEIKVEKVVADKARSAIEKMVQIGRQD